MIPALFGKAVRAIESRLLSLSLCLKKPFIARLSSEDARGLLTKASCLFTAQMPTRTGQRRKRRSATARTFRNTDLCRREDASLCCEPSTAMIAGGQDRRSGRKGKKAFTRMAPGPSPFGFSLFILFSGRLSCRILMFFLGFFLLFRQQPLQSREVAHVVWMIGHAGIPSATCHLTSRTGSARR